MIDPTPDLPPPTLANAVIDRAQKYVTPEQSGDGYSWGGAAIITIDATVTDYRGRPRPVRVALVVGEQYDDHAVAAAIVKALNDAND